MPCAWSSDRPPTVYPVNDTPHLFAGARTAPLGRRRLSEVQFPASKVWMFEEFDRLMRPEFNS